jgi:hypothetical protein
MKQRSVRWGPRPTLEKDFDERDVEHHSCCKRQRDPEVLLRVHKGKGWQQDESTRAKDGNGMSQECMSKEWAMSKTSMTWECVQCVSKE